VRGAYNKIMKLAETNSVNAVVASSAGNHAQGVAFAAQAAGISATIVMPRSAPIAKVSATKGYNAEVELYGDIYDDAYNRALAIQEETGSTFIHPFDDDDVIAGQGTIGLEILRDLPGVDMVFVPAGGGGLLSGVASCLKQVNPRVKIIGVQAAGAQSIAKSFHAGSLVVDDKLHTIADGIAVKTPGSRTMELINAFADDIVTVSDSQIAATILMLLERSKQVVEPAGAVSLAAAINNKKLDIAGKKVVCLLSGGNIDVSFIHRIVEKGLLTRGRNMKFQTVMRDVPGSLEKFASIVASNNANITMVQHDRLKADLDIDEAILHVVCEVGGFEHGRQVVSDLEREGYRVIMESEVNYLDEDNS
jgi:threonine dehydratase